MAKRYHSLVGGLLFICRYSRPDIAYAVGVLSKYVSNPHWSHWRAAIRVAGYLKKTKNFYLHFSRGNEESSSRIVVFSDADLAGDPDTNRSTNGSAVYCGANLIGWRSKVQQTVATSTCEAELVALSQSAKDGIGMQLLLNDILSEQLESPFELLCDNKSAIDVARHPKRYGKLKHVERSHFFVREVLENEKAKLEKVKSDDNIADIFTKPLGHNKFIPLRSKLKLVDSKAISSQPSSGSVGPSGFYAKLDEKDIGWMSWICTCCA